MSNFSKKISTTQLAKLKGLDLKTVNEYLIQHGFIVLDEEGKKQLTKKGSEAGGEYKNSTKYGTYIVWNENMEILPNNSPNDAVAESTDDYLSDAKFISVTRIGEHFGISPRKINSILSEIGWIKKEEKNWVMTARGRKQGGQQKTSPQSGNQYVLWSESLLKSKVLIETIAALEEDNPKVSKESKKESIEFRDKFKAEYRATDGHFVRSKAEMSIDNWLYMARIAHAYERQLPIEEDAYCDFYIPEGNVYIEYWGYENNKKYSDRKKVKQDIYKDNDLNLIELEDDDVKNLDDILPKLLLKFGVKSY